MTEIDESIYGFNVNEAFEAFKKKVENMTLEERKEYFEKMGLKINIENK